MSWTCFSAKGVGKISVTVGKMNAPTCKQILQENLMSFVESLITFSTRIMIPSIELNLRTSGYLKIMLMFCNGQFNPQI